MQPDGNPFVGPRPFDSADAELFFGRDREVADLVALIVSNPVVLLYAASGAGKSSLLNAAVMGRLERTEQCELLSVARVRGLREQDIGDRNVFIASVLSHLSRGESSADSLRSYLRSLPHRETTEGFPAPRALVIDQFEELFTAYPEHWADRPAFFEDIAGALADDPLLRVVLAIREDFVAQLDPYARLLPDGLRARYRLERLSATAALRAAREPARRAGRPFADGVAEELVEDLQKVRIDTERGPMEVVGEFVEPVQLQVACRSVWETLPETATEITEEHRQRFGNVNEVLGRFYDEAIGAAATAARMRERTLRSRFAERFITSMGTRGTVFWTREETGGIPAAAIQELDARHLVRAELRAGARWYELTHDRLIEPIRSSNRAVDTKHRARLRRRVVVAAAAVGAALATVVGLITAGPSQVRATTIRVVSPGQSARNEQLQRQVADARDQLATALARTNAGAVAWVSARSSKDLRSIAYAGDEVVAFGGDGPHAASILVPDAPWTSAGSSRRVAYATRGTWSLTALSDGRLVAQQHGSNAMTVVGKVAGVTAIALSDDGRFAAAVDDKGVLRTFERPTGGRDGEHHRYEPPRNVTYATPSFGNLDDQVAVVGSDGWVRAAGTRAHQMDKAILLPPSLTGGITVSADGKLLAAWGPGAVVALLDTQGNVIGAFPGGGAVSAVFSPNGDRLAVGYRDGRVRAWRTLPDLVFAATRFAGAGTRTRLGIEVANVGGSASGASSLVVSGARVPSGTIQTHATTSQRTSTKPVAFARRGDDPVVRVPALGSGSHATLDLRVVPRGLPIDLRIVRGATTEQSYTNNATTLVAPRDVRARIVRAALAAVHRSSEIRWDDSSLHATMQGVLDHVHLPNVPRTATTTGLVTWCYHEAGAPDPNGPSGKNYTNASGRFLRREGRQTTTALPGDLVFYEGSVAPGAPVGRSTAVYVGNGDVVTFVKGHVARVPLTSLPSPRTIRTYLPST